MVRALRVALVASAAAIGASIAAVAPATVATADPAPSTSFVPGGAFVRVAPTRVLDTRTGVGAARGATKSVRLQVTGVAGVPPVGAAAVVLNVTVTAPTASGFLSVSPTGTTATSSVNFHAGQTVAQLVTSKLGSGGEVEIRSIATTQVVADVVGWFTDRDQVAGGATYHAAANRRVLDTRGSGGPLSNGVVRRIVLPGVTAGTAAAIVDMTAVRPTSAVYVTAWGAGARPATSSLNAARAEVRSNRAVVPVAPDGSISVFSNGRTDVVVDLNGWFATGAGGAYFVPMDPTRIVDSRQHLNLFDIRYDNHIVSEFGVAGHFGVPTLTSIFRPVGVWLTASVVTDTWSGWVGFAPATSDAIRHEPIATTSDINFGPGVTSNSVISATGLYGSVVRTGLAGSSVSRPADAVGMTADVSGFFSLAVPQPPVGMYATGAESDSSGTLADYWDRPVQGADGDVVQVAASEIEKIVRYRDGTVRSWWGTGAPVVLDRDVVDIASSLGGVYVVRSDGTVWTDDFAPGMHGTADTRVGYSQVPGVTDAVSVSPGGDGAGAFAVRRDGSVIAWGRDSGVAATPLAAFGTGVVAVSANDADGACAAYADGSVGYDPGEWADGHTDADPVVRVAGVAAVEVIASITGNCLAVDRQHRLHAVDFVDRNGPITPTDRVIDGPPVAEALGHYGGWREFGVYGSDASSLWILGLDGHIYDLGSDGTWNALGGFSGVTAIGGRAQTMIWVPPAS